MKGVVVTGTGAICGAGRTPAAIVDALLAGRSALAPIASWDLAQWPRPIAAEIPDYNAAQLAGDRKLLKLIRRTDVVGLYAASEAVRESGYVAHRDGLDEGGAAAFSERTGLYAGSGGGNYQNQYDYFPLIVETGGALSAFGRELGSGVNPMWLLKSLPNNVLCHVGIRFGIKGPNACITNHSVSGMLAIVEAAAGIANGEADRAVAVGHDTPIEPQNVLYYHGAGLLAKRHLKAFDVARDGSLMGEGAGALMVESESSARARGASVLGRILGSGHATESEGLLAIRDDGSGPEASIRAALADAGLGAQSIDYVNLHATATPKNDAMEAQVMARVFAHGVATSGTKPYTGHLLGSAGATELGFAWLALDESNARPRIDLPRHLWDGKADPALPRLDLVEDKRRLAGPSHVMSNSFAFGGSNASLILAG